MATNDQILSELTALRKDLDSLTRIVRKVKTTVEDPNGEKAAARRNNPNNGFNRPRQVTAELKKFLGLEPDATISRTDVTKGVYGYIREHNLKHPDNGKIIMPDANLKALLGTDDDTQITFTNIQKFISPHYVKDDPKPAAPVETPTPAPAEPEAPVQVPETRAVDETPKATPTVVKKKVVKTVKKAVIRKPVAAA